MLGSPSGVLSPRSPQNSTRGDFEFQVRYLARSWRILFEKSPRRPLASIGTDAWSDSGVCATGSRECRADKCVRYLDRLRFAHEIGRRSKRPSLALSARGSHFDFSPSTFCFELGSFLQVNSFFNPRQFFHYSDSTSRTPNAHKDKHIHELIRVSD